MNAPAATNRMPEARGLRGWPIPPAPINVNHTVRMGICAIIRLPQVDFGHPPTDHRVRYGQTSGRAGRPIRDPPRRGPLGSGGGERTAPIPDDKRLRVSDNRSDRAVWIQSGRKGTGRLTRCELARSMSDAVYTFGKTQSFNPADKRRDVADRLRRPVAVRACRPQYGPGRDVDMQRIGRRRLDEHHGIVSVTCPGSGLKPGLHRSHQFRRDVSLHVR